jgi:hypothetical protein
LTFRTIKNKTITNIRKIDNLFEYNATAEGITIGEAEFIYNELMSNKTIINFLNKKNIPLERIQLSFLNTLGSGVNINYNNANIYVGNFKRIYEFSEIVYEITDLRLDMAKNERIRNYKIVASVTSLLSAFLIIFSLLIIIILLSNILSNHLNKIRKNIGLLMAFGVNTKIIFQSINAHFCFNNIINGRIFKLFSRNPITF